MKPDEKELVHQSQPDVSERRLARVYAESLLNAAESQNAVQEVVEQLHDLVRDVARRDPYVQAFFTSGVIGKEKRTAAIKSAFEGNCSPLIVNLLLVLNDHERLMLFRTVIEELAKLDDLRRRRFPVQVHTAVGLTPDQKTRLLDDLQKTFRLEPILAERVEPDLLGGLILRIADWVFDGSVRTQLVNLRKQLREMSSHEIQSRRNSFSAAEGN